MKARLVLACAVAGFAASVFGATSASAQDGYTGTIAFASDSVEPGGFVDITGTCTDTEVSTFPVSSPALKPAELRRSADGKTLAGRAAVKSDATPEIYPVSFTCGAEQVQGYLRVTEKKIYAAIGVEDPEIRAGDEVLVMASCQDPAFQSSKVSSPALTSPDLVRQNGKPLDTPLTALARVHKDAKPGTYPISFTCAGKKVSGKFTVLGKPAQAKAGQVPVKPKGAAETGEPASQPVEDASNSTAFVLGGAGALLAAAGAGGWLLYRRRQRV